jgi:hypothetical protein
MSMHEAATGDPDLPAFGNNNLSIPSLPPSPSADENDASRLFWVPASLHPELAPKEFKSFLESKADLIKRKSGDYSSLGPERQGSSSSLRRKRSMLSRQINDSSGFQDGADRLERQRSQSSSKRDGILSPNLQQLETLVDDSKPTMKDSSLVRGMQNVGITPGEDQPILPPAPPGHSLRRSTRTQYKKGSLKKGEKPPYSKRVGRGLSESAGSAPPSIASSSASEDQPILGPTRVPNDSPSSTSRVGRTLSASSRSTAFAPGSTTSSTFDSILDNPEAEEEALSSEAQSDAASSDGMNAKTAAYARQWQARASANGRPTTSQSEQQIPAIVESPPNEPNRSGASYGSRSSERDTPSLYSPKSAPGPQPQQQQDSTPSKRSLMSGTRQSEKETASSLDNFANHPEMIPGNSTRTDNLSFIPTLPEERKPEERKSEGKKSKKDSDGSRKSSWHWLLGSEEKDKKKDKDSESKKLKSKLADKVHSSPRTEVAQSSLDNTPKGRESLILDRLDPKLEEERRKDGVRRASGDSKKEKDGIFSSIFGGGRKKHSSEGHHRKNSSRNLSPDPPMRELHADVDYPWTRFSILEERAIYRMAHIKLANPRRALYSQVLLSNFMYSYLEKVQQMHPHMMVASSGSQRQSKSREQQQQQPDEYLQYQRYQEVSGTLSLRKSLFANRFFFRRKSSSNNNSNMRTAPTMTHPCMTTTTILTIAISSPKGGVINRATRPAMLTARATTSMGTRPLATMSSWMTTMTTICGESGARRLPSFFALFAGPFCFLGFCCPPIGNTRVFVSPGSFLRLPVHKHRFSRFSRSSHGLSTHILKDHGFVFLHTCWGLAQNTKHRHPGRVIILYPRLAHCGLRFGLCLLACASPYSLFAHMV